MFTRARPKKPGDIVCKHCGKNTQPEGMCCYCGKTQTIPIVPCMTPGCGMPALWKGICKTCYGQAKGLIDARRTTWENLVTMGMVKVDDKAFIDEFNRREVDIRSGGVREEEDAQGAHEPGAR